MYQNIPSRKEKRTLISLDKNSNTEFHTDDIQSSLNFKGNKRYCHFNKLYLFQAQKLYFFFSFLL